MIERIYRIDYAGEPPHESVMERDELREKLLGQHRQLPESLRQVAFPQAAVLQVRELSAGGSVGYNARFTAARPMRVATSRAPGVSVPGRITANSSPP